MKSLNQEKYVIVSILNLIYKTNLYSSSFKLCMSCIKIYLCNGELFHEVLVNNSTKL